VELCDRLGIAENAARRHLDILENKGLVEHHFKRATRGRPKKLYRLTQAGRDLFPRQTGLLLSILLGKCEERLGSREVEDLLDAVVEELVDRFVAADVGDDLETRLEALVRAFDEFGFFSTLSRQDGSYSIEYRNCVFSDVSRDAAALLCKVHRRVVRRALRNVDISQNQCVMKGDCLCRHVVSIKPDR
jgi:predicted ArsR family transcriptional regulator